MPVEGAVLVAVDSFDGYRHAVDAELGGDEEGVGRRIFHLLDCYVSKAHLAAKGFDGGGAHITETDDKGIKIGRFGRPWGDLGDAAFLVGKGGVPLLKAHLTGFV